MPSESSTCQAVIGLLVPRPCGEPAKGACAQCGRGVCSAHATVHESGLVCPHCAAGEEPPQEVLDVPADLAFRPEDLEAFRVERLDLPHNAWSDLT